MDALKQIAVTSYNGVWSPEVKEEAKAFFQRIDSSEDGEVTLVELKNSGIISNRLLKALFRRLDVNRDKVLAFDEIKTLYYYKYVVHEVVKRYTLSRTFCDGCGPCRRPVSLPDYSCFCCLIDGVRTYDLCSDCHAKVMDHEHPKWYMLDRKALAELERMKYLLFEDDQVQNNNQQNDKQDVANQTSIISSKVSMAGTVFTVAAAASECTIM